MFIITDEIPKSCSYCDYHCGLPTILRPDLNSRHPDCPIRELSLNKGFSVIDKKTGAYPDLEKLTIEKGLVHCDTYVFFLSENGNLFLLNENDNSVYCSPDRFEVVMEASR